MDASLCHQKSEMCCNHTGLIPAVNFPALPVHLPRGRRDAAKQEGPKKTSRGCPRGAVKGQGGQSDLGITP